MIMNDGLLRVFWPYDLPRSTSPGVIVGWRNSELDIFVLNVLEEVEVGFICHSQVLSEGEAYHLSSATGVASEGRQCLAHWSSLPQQPASNTANIFAMWEECDACTGHDEPA